MADQVASGVMTIEEYIRRYDEEGPFEIINGEVRPVTPTKMRHSSVATRLTAHLFNHASANDLGEPFVEAPFVLEDRPDWVSGSRVPDVMFVTAERLGAYREQYPDWGDKPLVLVPDLVVEIISPNDSYSTVQNKVAAYLRDGVRLVWVVEPETRTIAVHAPDTNQITLLHDGDSLSGGDVVPGFEMRVADLFV